MKFKFDWLKFGGIGLLILGGIIDLAKDALDEKNQKQLIRETTKEYLDELAAEVTTEEKNEES